MSRRFITATKAHLAEFRARPLDDQRWLIVYVDGFDFAGHTMIGALGVTAAGVKVPLGVVEGSTENATVVRHLITDLRDRGLDAAGGTLFILDGGKALRKAVTDVYGHLAVIARCRVHKERNVMDHLPEAQRPWVRRKLRQAWANPNAGEAEAALKALARQLDKVNPDAGASLREGLVETLTVTRLGVTGTLLKTVMSTNPVESMIEIVRANARNVKRWKDGDMRLRWAATGMLAAENTVPAGQGLPATPSTGHRPRTRRQPQHPIHPRCHSLTIRSNKEPTTKFHDQMHDQRAIESSSGDRPGLVGLDGRTRLTITGDVPRSNGSSRRLPPGARRRCRRGTGTSEDRPGHQLGLRATPTTYRFRRPG